MEVQPAPPTELAEVVALIAMEADMPEAQSPTLMIQSVLGKLAPREVVTEALNIIKEEEEGSSSTPGKDDAEDVPAGHPEVLLANTQLEQVEAPPQDQSLVIIEESVPEGVERSPEALGLEAEVQPVPPPATSSRGLVPNRGPAFVKVSLDASPYYESLRTKRLAPSTAIPMSCEGHPFFEGLPHIADFVKSFYDKLFSAESDIFKGCSVVWCISLHHYMWPL